MSNSNDQEPSKKKRRAGYACDFCATRRIKCNSSTKAGNICDNCISRGLTCTHKTITKELVHAQGYVSSLESRLEKLEALLHKVQPGLNIEDELGDSAQSMPDASNRLRLAPVSRNDDDTIVEKALADIDLHPLNSRYEPYFDKASVAYLIHVAMELKQHQTPQQQIHRLGFFPGRQLSSHIRDIWTHRLPRYLAAQSRQFVSFNFPPPDLLWELVRLYFEHVNLYMPLLHRPTFERHILDNLHLREEPFAGTLLLVCALGARFSNDIRVAGDGESMLAAGCHWYDQVKIVKTPLVSTITIHELQNYILSFHFRIASAHVVNMWVELGVGIRFAQEVGAHRRRPSSATPNAQDELWKRAVWVLIVLDRVTAAFKGRPSTLHEEEFDLECPVDCDDEYWYHPDTALNFKQPPDNPSLLSYFIANLGLSRIQGHALRTIYTARKPQWPSRICTEADAISEVDSALNEWLTTVPDHLRWDVPGYRDRDSSTPFHRQSIQLCADFYNLQILIHKPFIQTPSSSSWMSCTSGVVCSTAARSMAREIQAIYQPGKWYEAPYLMFPLFAAGIILHLNSWTRNLLSSAGSSKDKDGAELCTAVIKSAETRWLTANNLSNALYEVGLNVQERVLPDSGRGKRQRDDAPDPQGGTIPFGTGVYDKMSVSQDQPVRTGPSSAGYQIFPSLPFVNDIIYSSMGREYVVRDTVGPPQVPEVLDAPLMEMSQPDLAAMFDNEEWASFVSSLAHWMPPPDLQGSGRDGDT